MFKRITITKTALAIMFTGSIVALAETYDLSWRSFDGGSGTSSGGEIELSGTIGQPDAGAMSGGAFAIVGGFWSAPLESSGGCTRSPAWICDGDVDGDGQVNPVDSGLVQAAFGSVDDQDLCRFDMDCDGQLNPVDAGIVQSLFGTCNRPRAVCP